jgi:hypothetical protein
MFLPLTVQLGKVQHRLQVLLQTSKHLHVLAHGLNLLALLLCVYALGVGVGVAVLGDLLSQVLAVESVKVERVAVAVQELA